MKRLRTFALVAALALAGAAAAGAPAAAHANYVKSNPAADARLVKPPTEIRVAFSEPPDPKGSQIQVLDEQGARWDEGATLASDEPNGLKVGLTPIGDGGYTVAWTTVSAVDGHETKGSFAFVVGNGPLPSLPDVPNASPAPTPLEVAGRAIGYAGIALALGCALFGLIVHAATGPAEVRRERQLFAFAGGAIAIGSAALVLAEGDRLPPRLELLLNGLFQEGKHRLVLDCRELDYVGSVGLGALIGFAKQAREHNGDVILLNVPDRIFKIIELLGFTKVLKLHNNEQDAFNCFAAS